LSDKIIIEQHEHYIKQTWRNRCRIAAANGVQDLVIPVHLSGNHTPMNEVRIDYDGIWQRQHWQSIRSAYGNSPFFEFYADYFSPFYEKNNWDKLIDFNSEIFSVTMKLLKINPEFSFTTEYIPADENYIDNRNSISPKKSIEEDPDFMVKRYVQVFEERHGFIPNLSIIDLLCCCGPTSSEILL
jgi:hypothetical protein